jgi:hypothetical protein
MGSYVSVASIGGSARQSPFTRLLQQVPVPVDHNTIAELDTTVRSVVDPAFRCYLGFACVFYGESMPFRKLRQAWRWKGIYGG